MVIWSGIGGNHLIHAARRNIDLPGHPDQQLHLRHDRRPERAHHAADRAKLVGLCRSGISRGRSTCRIWAASLRRGLCGAVDQPSHSPADQVIFECHRAARASASSRSLLRARRSMPDSTSSVAGFDLMRFYHENSGDPSRRGHARRGRSIFQDRDHLREIRGQSSGLPSSRR